MTQRVSTSQSPGTVLAQSPSTGTSVHAGDKVDLTVAQAPKEVAVPNVVGQSETAGGGGARTGRLQAEVRIHVRPPNRREVGMVLQQSPAGGAKATQGRHRDDRRRGARHSHDADHDSDHAHDADHDPTTPTTPVTPPPAGG